MTFWKCLISHKKRGYYCEVTGWSQQENIKARLTKCRQLPGDDQGKQQSCAIIAPHCLRTLQAHIARRNAQTSDTACVQVSIPEEQDCQLEQCSCSHMHQLA